MCARLCVPPTRKASSPSKAATGLWDKSGLCVTGFLWSPRPCQTAYDILFIHYMGNIALQDSARKEAQLGEYGVLNMLSVNARSREWLMVKKLRGLVRQDREECSTCSFDWWSAECQGSRENKHKKIFQWGKQGTNSEYHAQRWWWFIVWLADKTTNLVLLTAWEAWKTPRPSSKMIEYTTATKLRWEVCFPFKTSCNHSICKAINPEKELRCQFKAEAENISGWEIQV